MSKMRRQTLLVVGLALVLMLALAGTALAHVWTDQADYRPGSVVTLHGDNSDNAGYLPGETVHVSVIGPNDYLTYCDATADSSGAWSCQVTLYPDQTAVGSYTYNANGLTSLVSESGAFTDANPQFVGNTVYLTDCETASSSFSAGDTVCAHVAGLGSDFTGYLQWVPPAGSPFNTAINDLNGQDKVLQEVNACVDWTVKLYEQVTGQPDTLWDTVTFQVNGCAKDLVVTKTANASFTHTYSWDISKSVDQTEIDIPNGGTATFNYAVDVTHDAGTDGGWQVAGAITVQNPNSFAVAGVNVSDAIDNGGACTVQGGAGLSIPANSSVDVGYTCTSGSNPGSGTNTATATWDQAVYHTPGSSASGTATYDFAGVSPTIVDGSVAVTDPNAPANPLGTVHYTDPSPTSLTYSQSFPGNPGTCTTYDNTATFTTDTTGATGSASQSVKVCVGVDLTVSKTADPFFTRTYNWTIAKAVDEPKVVHQATGSVTFSYHVTAAQDAAVPFADSAWQVKGTITVSNPNDWEDITANVSDAVDNGGSCTLDDPAQATVTVPKSGKVAVAYTCTFTSGSAGTNTATAAWKASYVTPHNSASGTAGFAFTTPTTTVNKTVKVTDTFDGATTTLGTLTATDAAPYTSAAYNYTRSVGVPPFGCKSYTNTAALVETGQTASQTVTVCGPSLVTNSSLCTFANNRFKLIFTPDQNAPSAWKLNASNPGQFYYNVAYTGSGNEDVTITLPYPFVTQGAVPIHIYSSVAVNSAGGQTCLVPGGELANSSTQVTLANYSPQAFGSTTTVTIHVPPLTGGFAYINIHLDYGLKGTTGYAAGGGGNDAVGPVVIPDLQPYAFSDTTVSGSANVTSTNSFKKDPGVGGLVLNGSGDPVSGTGLKIYDASAKQLAAVTTDQDGWYMWQYKYTGKAASFTIKLLNPAQSQSVTLKSNGFVVANFTTP